jgi:hypothetical protein
MIQSIVEILAAPPAGVRSALAESQSYARMPSGVLEATKTRWRQGTAMLRRQASRRRRS